MRDRFRADPDYWDQKLANYLHDPPDKALRIPGHEERSIKIADALGGLPSPSKDFYQPADQIAAGMDRALLPGYSKDESKNGAVDFLRYPCLTHPTGEEPPLHLKFDSMLEIGAVAAAMLSIIREDIDGYAATVGLSTKHKNNPTSFSPARFHYVHHVLRERLAKEDVGGLGGVWYRIPADTRIPDHSIWQHCSLVSALSSCFQLSKQRRASLLVFSLTPVQDFISRARKLRDFWTGSLILSWLSFEGIREVIYAFGSDHILYPSLIGQPLVTWLLERDCGLSFPGSENGSSGIRGSGAASLPNKFVSLVPAGQEEQTAEGIRTAILRSWTQLGEKTLEMVERVLDRRDVYVREQFERQLSSYWTFHWSACPLLDDTSLQVVRQLLHEEVWQSPVGFMESAKNLPYETRGEGACYGLTHALVQTHLAAGKMHRINERKEEPGIKCDLHGDFEALRFDWKDGDDRNPRPGRDPFWTALKARWSPKSDFKASERLSAIGLVKRLAYRVCQNLDDHPLRAQFQQADRFPSTTEMALADWLNRLEKRGLTRGFRGDARLKLAQYIHESELERQEKEDGPEITDLEAEERALCFKLRESMEKAGDPIQDDDKYYAILLMDGDRMGSLVNGETIASRWETVLHPDLAIRLRNPGFDNAYKTLWEKALPQKRLLAPGVHAAISEALGDFALHSVPSIIARNRGQLIYAGGDDVCAVLPVSGVLQAAREIARLYSAGFLFMPADERNDAVVVSTTWQPSGGRLALQLGRGSDISVSAGILIAHHKKPLSVAMRRAHELLVKKAKDIGGRNGLALELEKRSGGARLFMSQWDEKPVLGLQSGHGGLVRHFMAVGQALGRAKKRSMSVSLVYRLEQLRPALEAIVNEAPGELHRFLNKQLERSDREMSEEQRALLYQHLIALLVRKHGLHKTLVVDTVSLNVAKFIGGRIDRHARGNGGVE
jgi:CRISPR-associated protein Cmr2